MASGVVARRKPTVIYDVVHGYTEWEPALRTVIDHPVFQRLRHVKQLCAVLYVYPCATHSRFEHSLGTGHLAGRMAAHLFAHDAARAHGFDEWTVLTFKLAGLCHDLGHGPGSHAFDRVVSACHTTCAVGRTHEERSVALLRHIWAACGGAHLPERVIDDACELIHPVTRRLPPFWYQVVANDTDGVDVDKLDYLVRDCRYTGMPCTIDAERFLRCSRVVDGVLCYAHHMVHDIAQLFVTRYKLHERVYAHTAVRAAELMLVHIMRRVLPAHIDLDRFLQLDDDVFRHASLLGDAEADVDALRARLAARDLYTPMHPSDEGKRVCTDVVVLGHDPNPLTRVWFYDPEHAGPFRLTTLPAFCPSLEKNTLTRTYTAAA